MTHITRNAGPRSNPSLAARGKRLPPRLRCIAGLENAGAHDGPEHGSAGRPGLSGRGSERMGPAPGAGSSHGPHLQRARTSRRARAFSPSRRTPAHSRSRVSGSPSTPCPKRSTATTPSSTEGSSHEYPRAMAHLLPLDRRPGRRRISAVRSGPVPAALPVCPARCAQKRTCARSVMASAGASPPACSRTPSSPTRTSSVIRHRAPARHVRAAPSPRRSAV